MRACVRARARACVCLRSQNGASFFQRIFVLIDTTNKIRQLMQQYYMDPLNLTRIRMALTVRSMRIYIYIYIYTRIYIRIYICINNIRIVCMRAL